MSEHIDLKWGTLKGWHLETDASKEAVRRYLAGPTSLSAMAQHDTQAQKQALCDLIDILDGTIVNNWTGEEMTKEEAKKYVLEY